ncbi:MAG: hypothetical protein H7Z37_04610 [Pyrinomonadaceae bacterium]|nr:hypothetical protein [Pyrinomonadaceae bacterium]
MINKRAFLILIGLIFLCGALTFDATAQTASKKRTRRKKTTRVRTTIVNPNQVQITPQTISLEPEIVSTAEGSQTDENSTNSTQNTELSSGATTNQTTENSNLSGEKIEAMRRELLKGINEQKSLSNLEKLSVAEERAENLRLQLANTIEKESNLKARLEQITYQSTPENIERDTAMIGSLRPEQVRESRRKMLENEKKGVSDQLVQIQTNRSKLETAITSADNLVERLRTAVESDSTANDEEPATKPVKPTTTPENANPNSTGSQPQ